MVLQKPYKFLSCICKDPFIQFIHSLPEVLTFKLDYVPKNLVLDTLSDVNEITTIKRTCSRIKSKFFKNSDLSDR